MGKDHNLLEELDKTTLPQHVAIIMDGNGRWAQKRLMPRFAGHKSGVNTVRAIVEASVQLGIKALTLFAFSSENWQRPQKEVDTLMDLFVSALEREVAQLHKNNVCLKFIGDRTVFSSKLQQRINESESLTAANSGLQLSIAANYGGKWDILQAVQKIAAKVKANELEPSDITVADIETYMCLADMPAPDLFIRTGGEQRISNFLIWQLAYTELYFTEVLWPDFDITAFIEAIKAYSGRQRRFGLTGEQVAKQGNA
ncbi:MAG: isoprenyl transferase [Gammaproteobacteria bacterium]|nr:isoprenyl transferase [Gammaproteobacteria bacterium]MDH5652821.1 isoprenyl transferase [Gammaproteobacteria bacterium]